MTTQPTTPTTPSTPRPHKLHVLAALAVLGVLGLLFAVRLATTDGHAAPAAAPVEVDTRPAPEPPAATVPAPAIPEIRTLHYPCWSCPESHDAPLRFYTDLDLLAPLGTGEVNAALWFKDFTKGVGRRAAEAEAAEKRYLPPSGAFKKTLAPDDPLLLEAEPWADMAAMRFYPDVYPFAGFETRIPNLLLAMSFAQSWANRGAEAADRDAAMDDFRRTIRWGRLLRQDDTTIIADLVGLVCIQYGVQGIYDRAVRDGDAELALLAAVVLSEVAPQRLLTSDRIDKALVGAYIERTFWGTWKVSVPDGRLDDILRLAGGSPDRRFTFEALMSAALILHHGPSDQREKVEKAFETMMGTKDPGRLAMVRWARDHAPDDETIRDYYIER